MQLHSLKKEHPNKKSQQVGRGGKRGKTSGRGLKGQTARAGNKRRPQMRDIIKKIPKLRGYRFRSFATKPLSLNVGALNVFEAGSIVDNKSLFEKKLIRKVGGRFSPIKILGNGDLNVKLSVEGCEVSKGARIKIEKVGGKIK